MPLKPHYGVRTMNKEALKLAIQLRDTASWYWTENEIPIIEKLIELLAQPAQEPVLVVEKEPDYMSRGHFYTGTKPHIDPTKIWSLPIGTKLYTIPPQRTWIGLTDDEFKKIIDDAGFTRTDLLMIGDCVEQLVDLLEAKLKEKNT